MDFTFVYPEIVWMLQKTISEKLEKCSFSFFSVPSCPLFSCCTDTAHKLMKTILF